MYQDLTLSQLKQLAITAAKTSDWSKAIDANTTILERTPQDTAALNRLGVAWIQLKSHKKAKTTFEKVLSIDKTNLLAQKNLDRLKTNKHVDINLVGLEDFIEEPGKTRVVELHRLAGSSVLSLLAAGTACTLKVKKRYISVEAGNHYVGALPEDLSFRLTKLINSGNTYRCFIRSVSNHHVSVYLREEFRASCNSDTPSFPVSKPMTGSDEEFVDDPLLKEEGFGSTFGGFDDESESDDVRSELPETSSLG